MELVNLQKISTYIVSIQNRQVCGIKKWWNDIAIKSKKLYSITRELAEINEKDIVYDLYTGTGTIAQFISKKAKIVIGIDSVEEGIMAAYENAKFNKIKNCKFYTGDMKDIFTNEFIRKNGQPSIIITDPPRDGMHKNVIKELIKLSPDKIIYVSCNSSTQARDLKLLKFNYSLLKSKAIDMFPHTQHVENIVLLGKI